MNHPHLRRLWMHRSYPLTTIYTVVVLTFIAAGLSFGWFPLR